ncbi:hypothetical protein QR680_003299 [Steinernema hermaphroditum]|uniref:Uncharacterized protein n=1 Tax=Steinernema hermaphroditum TaxID=289476 RepID=A0AA39H808_9BILA|nr:hypothetical protein QR680_003299 [Steinernema hermaphroditum]
MEEQAGPNRPQANGERRGNGIQHVQNEYSSDDSENDVEEIEENNNDYQNDLDREEAIFGNRKSAESEKGSEEEEDSDNYFNRVGRHRGGRLQNVTTSNNTARGNHIIATQRLNSYVRKQANLIEMRNLTNNNAPLNGASSSNGSANNPAPGQPLNSNPVNGAPRPNGANFPGSLNNNRSANNPAPDNRPASDPVPNNRPANNPAPDNRPANNPALNRRPANNPAPDNRPANNPAPSSRPANNPAPNNRPANNPAPNSRPTNNAAPNNRPANNPAPNQPSNNNPVNGVPRANGANFSGRSYHLSHAHENDDLPEIFVEEGAPPQADEQINNVNEAIVEMNNLNLPPPSPSNPVVMEDMFDLGDQDEDEDENQEDMNDDVAVVAQNVVNNEADSTSERGRQPEQQQQPVGEQDDNDEEDYGFGGSVDLRHVEMFPLMQDDAEQPVPEEVLDEPERPVVVPHDNPREWAFAQPPRPPAAAAAAAPAAGAAAAPAAGAAAAPAAGAAAAPAAGAAAAPAAAAAAAPAARAPAEPAAQPVAQAGNAPAQQAGAAPEPAAQAAAEPANAPAPENAGPIAGEPEAAPAPGAVVPRAPAVAAAIAPVPAGPAAPAAAAPAPASAAVAASQRDTERYEQDEPDSTNQELNLVEDIISDDSDSNIEAEAAPPVEQPIEQQVEQLQLNAPNEEEDEEEEEQGPAVDVRQRDVEERPVNVVKVEPLHSRDQVAVRQNNADEPSTVESATHRRSTVRMGGPSQESDEPGPSRGRRARRANAEVRVEKMELEQVENAESALQHDTDTSSGSPQEQEDTGRKRGRRKSVQKPVEATRRSARQNRSQPPTRGGKRQPQRKNSRIAAKNDKELPTVEATFDGSFEAMESDRSKGTVQKIIIENVREYFSKSFVNQLHKEHITKQQPVASCFYTAPQIVTETVSFSAVSSVNTVKALPAVDKMTSAEGSPETMQTARSSGSANSGSTAYEDAREFFENEVPVKAPSPPSPIREYILPPGFEASDEEDDIEPLGDIIPVPVPTPAPVKKAREPVRRGRGGARKRRGRPPTKRNNIVEPEELPVVKMQSDAASAEIVHVNDAELPINDINDEVEEPQEPEEVQTVEVVNEPVEEEASPPAVVAHRPRSRTRRRRSGVDMLISHCRDTKVLTEEELQALKDGRNIQPTGMRPRPRRSNSSTGSRDNSNNGRPASVYTAPRARSPVKRLDVEHELDIMIAARELQRKPRKTREPQNNDVEEMEEIPPFNEVGYEEYDYNPELRYEVVEQFFDSYYDYMMQHNFENVWEFDISKNSPKKTRSVSRARSRTPARPKSRGRRSGRSSMAPYSDVEDNDIRLTSRHKNTDFELFKYLRSEQFKKDRHNRNERIRRQRVKVERDLEKENPDYQEKSRKQKADLDRQFEEGGIWELAQAGAQAMLDEINANERNNKKAAAKRGRSSSAALRRSNSAAAPRQRKARGSRSAAASTTATPGRRRSAAVPNAVDDDVFDQAEFNAELSAALEDETFRARATTPNGTFRFGKYATIDFGDNPLYSPCKPYSGFIPYTGPPVPSGRRSQYRSPNPSGNEAGPSRGTSRRRSRASQSASRPQSRAPSRPRPPPTPSVPDDLYKGPRTRSRSRSRAALEASNRIALAQSRGSSPRRGVGFSEPEPTPKRFHTKAQRAQTPGPNRSRLFGKEPKEPSQRGRKRGTDHDDEGEGSSRQIKRSRRRSERSPEPRRTPGTKRSRKRRSPESDDDDSNDEAPPVALKLQSAKKPRIADEHEQNEFVDIEGDNAVLNEEAGADEPEPAAGASVRDDENGHPEYEDDFDPDQPSTSRAAMQPRRLKPKPAPKIKRDRDHDRHVHGHRRSHQHGHCAHSPQRRKQKKKDGGYKVGDSILKGSTNVFNNSLVTLYCVKCQRRPPHVRMENANPQDEYFECCFCKTRIFLYRNNDNNTSQPDPPKADKYTEETIRFKQLGTGKARDQSEASSHMPEVDDSWSTDSDNHLEDEEADPQPSTSSSRKTSTKYNSRKLLPNVSDLPQSSTSSDSSKPVSNEPAALSNESDDDEDDVMSKGKPGRAPGRGRKGPTH